jgi:hypothetical protein
MINRQNRRMELRTFNNQRGIALGPVIFIIAILAILAAAIAAGSGAFNANTNTESAKAMAETIINQADQIAMGVQNVYVGNACSLSQITFSNPTATGYNGGTDLYANSNAPSDGSCNVFLPNGGSVLFPTMQSGALDPCCYESGTTNEYGYPVFTGGYNWGQGTQTIGNLVVLFPNLSLAVCKQINYLLKLTSTLNQGIPYQISAVYGSGMSHFTGSLSGSTWNVLGNGVPTQGCVYQVDNNSEREFYRILIVQ